MLNDYTEEELKASAGLRKNRVEILLVLVVLITVTGIFGTYFAIQIQEILAVVFFPIAIISFWMMWLLYKKWTEALTSWDYTIWYHLKEKREQAEKIKTLREFVQNNIK